MKVDNIFGLSDPVSSAFLRVQAPKVIHGYRTRHHFQITEDGIFMMLLKLTQCLVVIFAEAQKGLLHQIVGET